MAITLKIDNAIGILELDQDNSKVNLLTGENLRTIDKILDDVAKHKELKALLIISKKKDVFIAGADISEIEKIVEVADGAAKAKAGQDVLNKLEDLSIPTIAVIDGVALGGGCELALACLYRLSTFNDKVRIGLPEVNLGFVPGFGGTYRLPRTVGLSEGIKMILAGKPITSEKAFKIGLFDRLYPQVGLDKAVNQFVADVVAGKITKKKYARKKEGGMNGFLNDWWLGNQLVFDQSTKGVLKATKGFYPAPLKAVEVIKQNFYTDRIRGLEIEAAGFAELAITPVSKNLVQLFYLSEKYRKLSLDGADDIKGQTIKRAGVLGAGIMGGGIAHILSTKDIWVRVKDISQDAIAKGYQAAAKIFQSDVKKRKFSKAEAAERMAHISGTLDYSGFQHVDIVIEAVVENIELKKKVFKELSEVCSPNAILATNTSALSVTEMAKATKDPSKVIGFHFFNPVNRMPLVEVITTPMTSKETIVTTLNLVKRLGKTPILVKDSCGFIVNRILLAYINEAGRILEETGSMEAIDKTMTKFGMPMGPFTLSDEVGLDVGIKVLHILENAFGSRFKPTNVFEKVFAQGLYGKKSSKGFYLHGGKERSANPTIATLVGSASSTFNAQQCLDRLLLIMINEAAGCLQDGIVTDPGAVDIGMIFGTGFPPFHGGLLRYADALGIDSVIQRLQQLNTELKTDRFTPNPYILKLKSENKKFYS